MMSKTMKLTLFALAVGSIALAAAPSASAGRCATTNPLLTYAVETCNYVLSGEAAQEAGETVDFVEGQATETVEFLVDQYGDQLP